MFNFPVFKFIFFKMYEDNFWFRYSFDLIFHSQVSSQEE